MAMQNNSYGRVIPALSCPLSYSSAELCEPARYSSPSANPGGLWLSPQQGIPGAGVSSLKWCVLAKCYNEKQNCSLGFSQSCTVVQMHVCREGEKENCY